MGSSSPPWQPTCTAPAVMPVWVRRSPRSCSCRTSSTSHSHAAGASRRTPQPREGLLMLLLNNADIERVLTMEVCLEALDGVFAEMAAGEAVGMGRIDLYVPSQQQQAPYYRWAIMAGASRKDGYVCARMLSDMVAWPRDHGKVRENKYAQQPGTFCGLLFMFSAVDGTPAAMLNDGFLQHLRVGAGAGLGVKHLSRADSSTVGMIGSGGRGRRRRGRCCLLYTSPSPRDGLLSRMPSSA